MMVDACVYWYMYGDASPCVKACMPACICMTFILLRNACIILLPHACILLNAWMSACIDTCIHTDVLAEEGEAADRGRDRDVCEDVRVPSPPFHFTVMGSG